MSAPLAIDVSVLRGLLDQVPDPQSGRPLGSTGQIHHVCVQEGSASATIGLVGHSRPIADDFRREVADQLRAALPEGWRLDLTIADHQRRPAELGTLGLRCRSVIAIGSGKGGVGKSTVAAALALSLQRSGCSVGLLDADVYGPSIPQLLGLDGHPARVDNKIEPIRAHGMSIMSIGFMVPPEQAVIWRGPMLHSAVTQFLRDTAWGDLDYLIIDMPPGTGDVALSLSQLLPLSGAVVVCTPQKVALLDAIKAVAMFQKVNIPILGVVENMSTFICPDCGKRYDIFGSGGVQRFAQHTKLPFLGEIPIHVPLRERGDAGTTPANFDDPQVAPCLDQIARQLVRELSRRARLHPAMPQLPVLG